MMDPVTASVLTCVDAWNKEVAQRRERAAHDPVADAIESCASELAAVVKDTTRATAMIPVARWARARGIAASTARRWCVLGQIPGAAKDDRDNWTVPSGARRVTRIPAHARLSA